MRAGGWRGWNALGVTWPLLVRCWFRASPLVRVLWCSVWVLAAVRVSPFLALGLGVAVQVLLGAGVRLSWLRARWRSFASRAGVLGDAVGGVALGGGAVVVVLWAL